MIPTPLADDRGTPRVSGVVPAFNEAANLEPLLAALTAQLKSLVPDCNGTTLRSAPLQSRTWRGTDGLEFCRGWW